MSARAASSQPRLRAEIGVMGLWSLAVGLVISGEYFGWSYGWAAAGNWHALSAIDYPLPEAMAMVVGRQSGWIHMLVAVGLFGLLASFHGIILSCSRQMFALARAGYLPKNLAALHATRSTPHRALFATGIFGVVALASGATSQLITLSALGAIAMYICSMLALFRLRRVEPDLERTFRAPLYPVLPLIALGLSVISLGVIAYFNPGLTALFLAGFALSVLYYRATAAQRAAARDVSGGLGNL